MAKGERFAVGGTIRVHIKDDFYLDCIVVAIKTGKDAYPWEDRTKLVVVYQRPDRNGRWTLSWYHGEDPDVHPCEDAGEVLARWCGHILIHGEPPLEVEWLHEA
jgi:hypothetical protein